MAGFVVAAAPPQYIAAPVQDCMCGSSQAVTTEAACARCHHQQPYHACLVLDSFVLQRLMG